MDQDSRWEKGRTAARHLWGERMAEVLEGSLGSMSEGFLDFVMTSGFAMYERPQLDYKTRSAMTVAMLAALGRSDEIGFHVRGALNVGWTEEQIREMLMQVALYAGVPAAVEAYAAANKTFERINQKKGEQG